MIMVVMMCDSREVMNMKKEVKLEVEKECKSREKVEKKKVDAIRIGK